MGALDFLTPYRQYGIHVFIGVPYSLGPLVVAAFGFFHVHSGCGLGPSRPEIGSPTSSCSTGVSCEAVPLYVQLHIVDLNFTLFYFCELLPFRNNSIFGTLVGALVASFYCSLGELPLSSVW